MKCNGDKIILQVQSIELLCFGFKLWMLCSADGYPYNIQIYRGKQGEDHTTPLGTRVVSHLLACISDPASHVVYFDNFLQATSL